MCRGRWTHTHLLTHVSWNIFYTLNALLRCWKSTIWTSLGWREESYLSYSSFQSSMSFVITDRLIYSRYLVITGGRLRLWMLQPFFRLPFRFRSFASSLPSRVAVSQKPGRFSEVKYYHNLRLSRVLRRLKNLSSIRLTYLYIFLTLLSSWFDLSSLSKVNSFSFAGPSAVHFLLRTLVA